MRIFVLGAGATGSLLAQLLERQGHTVWWRRPRTRSARGLPGQEKHHPEPEVNARNLRGSWKAAKGCQLIVNASGVGVQ